MTERAQQSFCCPAHSEWVCCLQSFFENIPSLPAWSLHTFCFCFYNVIIKYNIVIKVYLNTISLLCCEESSQLRQQNRRRLRKMFTWLVTNAIIQLSHFHSQRKGLRIHPHQIKKLSCSKHFMGPIMSLLLCFVQEKPFITLAHTKQDNGATNDILHYVKSTKNNLKPSHT